MAAASIRSHARSPAPAARRFSSPRSDEARGRARRVAVGGDLRARRLFPELRRGLRQDRRQASDRRSQRTRRMGRVLPPLRLGRRRRHSHRHRHEPARPDPYRGAGHHSQDQCRRSRHHAGHEPSRLRREPQSPAQRQATCRPSARSPAYFPACRRRCRIPPASSSGRRSSSTWCGRVRRSTASIRRRKPTTRCSRWSS